MICALHIRKSRSTRICPGDRVHDPDRRLLRTFFDTKIGRGLFLLSTAAVVAGLYGPTYLIVALPAGGAFVAIAAVLAWRRRRATAWLAYKVSGPYLAALVVAMVVEKLAGR